MTGTSPRTARLERPLVLLLMGAGWLSILGNSPGDEYIRHYGTRTGPVRIEPDDALIGNACRVSARLSAPGRRASLSKGSTRIYEVDCVDGTNCLTSLQIPLEQSDCSRVQPDAGTADARVASDMSADLGRDSTADATADLGPDRAPTDADPADAASTPADAAPTDAATDGGYVVFRQSSSPAPPVATNLWRCAGTGGATILLRASRFVDDSSCADEKAVYRIVVETADGVPSVLEFRVEVKEPGGYFGC